MLKYVSRFFFEKIMPSVVATVAGAYIVNHYVTSKPADAPAAAVATVESKGVGAGLKAAAKAADRSVNVANIPEAGVRAKGISEKAIEKTPVEKVIETKDKAASSARTSAEVKRPQVHDKATRPAPEETAAIPDDRRDANDLARTVIERLRESSDLKNDLKARQANAPHVHDAPHAVVQDAVAVTPQTQPQVVPPPVSPLPPPIMISTPEPSAPASRPKLREDRHMDLVPPADIPVSQPLDLEASAAAPPSHEHDVTTVANDMLSAAKSVFQAVLPR